MKKSALSTAALTLSAFLLSLGNLQAIDFTTSGIYDENTTNTNQVDRNASGNAMSSTADNDYAGFSAAVATAYANDLGGVLTFDSAPASQNHPASTPLVASFGVNATKQITITSSAAKGYNIQPNNENLTGISGGNTFLNSKPEDASFVFTLGAIAGTAGNPEPSPDEKVVRVGFTIVGRVTAYGTTPIVIANFSDATSATANSVVFTSDATAQDQDTFYGFSAPTGTYIQSISISFGGDASNDQRRAIDDFGFITGSISPVPEPSTYALLLGGAGLGFTIIRRRRRS